jgi:hypothetical protein
VVFECDETATVGSKVGVIGLDLGETFICEDGLDGVAGDLQ